MKKILFPTDFSNDSQQAYIFALQVAKKLQGEVTTLHVYDAPELNAPNLSSTIKDILADIEGEQFDKYRKAVAFMNQQAEEVMASEIEDRHILEEGDDVPKTVLRVAQKEETDLIVMSTTGASGFKEVFFGSNASKVLENSTIPVLVIPKEATYKGIEKIAYATDFDSKESDEIAATIRLAEAFGAKVHFVHVNTQKTGEAAEKMAALKVNFGGAEHLSFEVIEGDEVLSSLNNYIQQHEIDLLTMLTHKQSLFTRLFSISYTEKMALHTDVPLLTYRAEENNFK